MQSNLPLIRDLFSFIENGDAVTTEQFFSLRERVRAVLWKPGEIGKQAKQISSSLSKSGFSEADLDTLVDSVVSRRASDLNNAGIEAQVAFLVEHGFDEASIQEQVAD